MQDKEMYQQLLGLSNQWEISEIKIEIEKLRVDICVKWSSEKAMCPKCKQESIIYDHQNERQWRHLDTMQFQTILHSRLPRVECREHGVQVIEAGWTEKYSRFTLLFERFVINVLQACSNQTKAKDMLGLSWDEVHRIQERAVERGLSRRKQEVMRYIGVDEKSFLQGHQYVTLVYDLEGSRVLDVAEDRTQESLSGMLKEMSQEQKDGVKAVAMDMWEAYENAVKSELPQAEIVHDKFHIIGHLSNGVDKVRKSEHKSLLNEKVDTLKGTKYLWLKNPENWNEQQQKLFNDLRGKELKVGRAWALKEMFSRFWQYIYQKPARAFFKKWYWWATHSRLKPMSDVAKMIKRRFENIITYLKHHITNAVAEGLNSKIQQIKSAARGFRNFNNYRTAILFFCGKLDLYPLNSQ
jgi:transposase